MPKIPTVSSRKFCKFLIAVGCRLERIEGDHHIFVKPDIERPVVVPIRKSLPIFIVLNNLKTLGISRREFVRRLKDI